MFLSHDPMAGAYPNMSASWNGYSYAHGNPVMYADPSGQAIPWLLIWGAAKFGAAVFAGATAIDAGNQVRANLYSGMSLGDAIHNVDGWGSVKRGAEWGISAGIGQFTGAYFAPRVAMGLLTARRAAAISAGVDTAWSVAWEMGVNQNNFGTSVFNTFTGSVFGEVTGYAGKGAGWMLGRLGAGADWLGHQLDWSPRLAFANGGRNSYDLNGGNILRMSGKNSPSSSGIWRTEEPPQDYIGIYQFNDLTRGGRPYVGSGNLRNRLQKHKRRVRFESWSDVQWVQIPANRPYDTTFMARVAERVQMFRVSNGDLSRLANDRWVLNRSNTIEQLTEFFDNPPASWPSEFNAPTDPRFFEILPG